MIKPNDSFYTFTKQVNISDGGLSFRIEREKATSMYDVLTSEPFLSTPKLVGCDESKGLLVFEKIDNMQIFPPITGDIWFERAGILLAHIHTSLRLPKELTIVRSKDEDLEGVVYVHGDFQPKNICFSGGKLVVFDWGLRPWNSEIYTKASPAVDIAAFLAHWWMPCWWDFRFPVAKLSRFLEIYNQIVGSESDIAQLGRRTLEQELAIQKNHRILENRRRSIGKRPLHYAKMIFNMSRMKHELFNEQ